MNPSNASLIVEALKRAQIAGAAVRELTGPDARKFAFVRDEANRRALLGTFSIEHNKPSPFYVSVVSTSRGDDVFQFMAFERRAANPLLVSSQAGTDGIVWTYSAAKQRGDNGARKAAFLEAAGADSIAIPLPNDDITEFVAAIRRAFELRHKADASGGSADDQEDDDGMDAEDASKILETFYESEEDRFHAAFLLSLSIRRAHELNAKSWCVTNPSGGTKVRLNVGVQGVIDLLPGKVSIVVDPDKLDVSARQALGERLELGESDAKTPWARVNVAPSEVPTLAPEVKIAHDAFLVRAASLSSPYAGQHHQAGIVDAIAAIVGEPLPTPALAKARYWKIAPGRNGDEWDACRKGGFIAIGWNKLGDLTNVSHEDFKQRADELDASHQVWTFRNIQVGDRIVANAGTKRVLGVGTVTGPYYFEEGGGNHKHRLRVRWDDTTERTVHRKSWFKTLLPIKPEDFKTIEKAPPVGAGGGDEKEVPQEDGTTDFEAILTELRNASLCFPAEVVASYLLALQAKRFVLLTGISGTGKTKLAQVVARAFADPDPVDEPAADEDPDQFVVDVRPYHREYARFIVPAQLARRLLALEDAGIKQIDLQVPGLPRSPMTVSKWPDNSSLLQVLLSGKTREWFMAKLQLGDRFALSRRLDGEQEWLDLRPLPRTSSQQVRPTGARAEVIEVRPDWTDKSAILGFYNPLLNKYEETSILRMLLRARDEAAAATEASPARPYFLIFDEMNLARVEHYFSDFLSVMESDEPLKLHENPEIEEQTGIPRRLTLPKNVFVIGTVNIDETTYMFSPKVLDRAFVLEFNEVNFAGIGRDTDDERASSTPLALVNFERLELRGKPTEEEWQTFEQVLGGELKELLGTIHKTLAEEHRHFGYRVAREIARFVELALAQSDGSPAASRAAFDIAVLAKILPKLHGSQGEVEEILKRLLAIAAGAKPGTEVIGKDGKWLTEAAAAPLPRTARKLGRMLGRLRARGHVSFIE